MEMMKAAVLTNIGKIELQQRERPQPKPDEVQVKVEYVGICGSDVHYFEFGRVGNFVVKKPIVLGHECGGTVTAVGSAVKKCKVGDRVALEPGVPCGKCEYCLSGRYNLCPDVRFMATPPYDGAFQEYVVHPEALTFLLPDGMSTMAGALIEPLAVGFHAAKQSGASVGQSAVVLGAGCIGLVTMMALHSMGVKKVIVADLLPKRLEKAKELGASAVINSGETDVEQAVLSLTDGAGADLVFETAGSPVTAMMTSFLVRRGGTITLVGMTPKPEFSYNFGNIMDKEATIKSVFRYCNLYPTAISAVACGDIPIEKIVSDTFPFDHAQEAMQYNIDHKADVTKIVLDFTK
ncbi:NAD(P)-dependent alcohol dehydrogenase [Caproicibacterium argilliputei]|uniref:NAD(P)-dependent alcohol dehydrogenase n=1 Tax=Caproicibacterium argilliputei TaxID=3030016 RepID=A0AA97H1L8_9FIRM|nr:NAD(P)-dependent alcohol dehydrogenase [Caproicibacterium argilliputei]WOC32641.1 NAD(P)-dependent alcohol dehydrogenase [Caproicibacterium argilliputei]